MDPIDILEQIRTTTKWSQEKLARKVGVSFPTMNSWINGKSQPRKNALEKIQILYFQIFGQDFIEEKVIEQNRTKVVDKKIKIKVLVEDAQMLENLILHFTHTTNSIEGSTMTFEDVRSVLVDKNVLINRSQIEQLEAINNMTTLKWVLQLLLENRNIDVDLILEIHEKLMRGIISDAGRFRNHSVRINKSKSVLANHLKILDLLKVLLKIEVDDPISYITYFHSEFEKIHPFRDGNGRTGRMIMLMQALKNDLFPPIISNERKYAYYKYLESAQTLEEYMLLENFICESIINSQNLLL